MNTKDMDSQNGVMSVEGTDNKSSGEQLIERVNIEGTPFTAIKRECEEGWFLTMGRYKVSDNYGTLEGLESSVGSVDWEILTNVIGIMVEQFNEVNKK